MHAIAAIAFECPSFSFGRVSDNTSKLTATFLARSGTFELANADYHSLP